MRGPVRGRFGAVLLDLDSCLIDSNDAHARAWSDALARFGRRVPPSRIRAHIGKGGKELLRDFVTPPEQALLAGAMGALQTDLFLERFTREVRAFPGAAAAVRGMRRAGIPVVLASSAQPRVIRRAFSLLRIEGVLTGETSADDVEKTKLFEDIFSLAIDRFRLWSRRPVAIGDTPYDIAAAHQLGVPCLAVRSGGFRCGRLRRPMVCSRESHSCGKKEGTSSHEAGRGEFVAACLPRGDDPVARSSRAGAAVPVAFRLEAAAQTGREIVLGEGPELFVSIRAARGDEREGVEEIHLAVKDIRKSRRAAPPDPLGGDSWTRPLKDFLALTLREFKRAPAAKWRKKRTRV